MHGLFRTHRLSGLVVVGFLVALPAAHGQNKSEPVNFETGDGVKIVGNFWASPKGKKAPVVILLHDFKKDKGGNCKADGWDSLGDALNKEGYAVLSFDFRGHGNSTTVTNAYWMQPQNRQGQKAVNLTKPPETISHTNFFAAYYPHFVDDIAAAKAFLDRKNDGGELNSANLIVIGAGEGATLGALWMRSEWVKQRAIGQGVVGAPLKLDPNPEGRDQVCAVWLDISPTVAGRTVPLREWMLELGKNQKVSMAFLYPKEPANNNSEMRAVAYLTAIIPNFKRGQQPKETAFEFTGEHGLATKLTGSQLLNKNLETEKFIVKDYLKPVLDKHQVTEWRNKDAMMSKQFWVFPGAIPTPAKNDTDPAPLPIPLQRFGIPQ